MTYECRQADEPVGWVVMITGLSVGVFSAGATCPPGWSGLNVRAVFDQGAAPRPAPAEPQSCSLGCTTECKAKMHGCASECPALPWQPPAPAEPQDTVLNYAAVRAQLGIAPQPAGGERKPLTESQIEDAIDAANRAFNGRRQGPSGQQITSYDDWKHWLAREVERRVCGITAAKGEHDL